MKKFIPAYLLMVLLYINTSAQDIHFSEFYNNPLQLNPSYTGFFNGDYRFTAIYRDQWSSVTTPYTTVEGTADLRLVQGSDKKNIIGLGINAFSDKAGDSQFSTNEITLSAAFSQALGQDRTSYFSTGVSAGAGDASINYSNLTFDEQWFNPNLPTTENVANSSYYYVDMSGGMSLHIIPNKFTNFNIGAAVFHINQPDQTFLGDNTSILYRKYVLDASAQFSISNNSDLYPKAMFESQGPYNEFDFGGLIRWNLSPGYIKNYGIYVGSFYRVGDALVVTTRLDMNALSIAMSYDITLSHLTQSSAAQGGPELSLIYIGKLVGSQHGIYCPRF